MSDFKTQKDEAITRRWASGIFFLAGGIGGHFFSGISSLNTAVTLWDVLRGLGNWFFIFLLRKFFFLAAVAPFALKLREAETRWLLENLVNPTKPWGDSGNAVTYPRCIG